MPQTRAFSFRALPSRARLAVLVSLALVLAACGDEITVPPPPPPVPLAAGSWRMDQAAGLDLPGAEISRRLLGGIEELTLLDSSFIEIEGLGTWEQRYYVRIFHAGTLDRNEVVFDRGTWTATPTSSSRPSVRAPSSCS